MTKQLILPKTYEYIEGKSDPKYKKFDKRVRLSYSAINSFKEEGYRGEFFASYFMGLTNKGNQFTEFGTWVGETVQYGVDKSGNLSAFDVETILKNIPRPDNAVYEAEIIVDRDSYILQGYIDVQVETALNILSITDVKTGGEAKKKEYASDKYNQTCLYSHARFLEGYEIGYSGVHLLHRKGHGQSAEHPLRLTGGVDHIPTPYSPERAEKFLKECDEVAKEIELYFKIFNKHLK